MRPLLAFAGLGEESSRVWSCDTHVEDVLAVELEDPEDKPEHNDKHVGFRVASYFPSVFDQVWFLTSGLFTGISETCTEFSKRWDWKRNLEELHHHEKSKSLTDAVVSSFVCTSFSIGYDDNRAVSEYPGVSEHHLPQDSL